jgi:hypothetical protein
MLDRARAADLITGESAIEPVIPSVAWVKDSYRPMM